MYRCVKVFFFSVVTLVLCATAQAAEPSASKSAHWQQLVNDKAFGYKDKLETVKEVKPYKPGAFEKFIGNSLEFFGGSTVQIVIWSAFGLLAVFVIYKLILANSSALFTRSKKKTATADNTADEQVEEGNWEALLQKAIAANDLKQTVRYSYMWLLQLLQEGELIRYRDDKTNFDYYRELEHTAYKQSFKQLSRQYEYVIYGNYTPTPVVYNQYIDLFNQVKRQLGR